MSGSEKKVELNYRRIEWVFFLFLGEDIYIVVGDFIRDYIEEICG